MPPDWDGRSRHDCSSRARWPASSASGTASPLRLGLRERSRRETGTAIVTRSARPAEPPTPRPTDRSGQSALHLSPARSRRADYPDQRLAAWKVEFTPSRSGLHHSQSANGECYVSSQPVDSARALSALWKPAICSTKKKSTKNTFRKEPRRAIHNICVRRDDEKLSGSPHFAEAAAVC